MEKIITIQEVKELTTKAGKRFLGITDTTGNRYSIFEPKLFTAVKVGGQIVLVGEENKGFLT